jgi:hypothetical protein
MAKITRLGAIGIVFGLTMTIAFAAQREQSANSRQNSGMMQIPMVAPLFIQGHHFTSTLVMVNAATIPEGVDVSVRALNGRVIASRRIRLAPHDQQGVELADLVKPSGSADVAGSIIVTPAPNSGSAIAAALSMTYRSTPESNYIDEELAMLNSDGSQTLRAVADSGSGSPYFAISSLSDSVQHIKVDCVSRKRVFSKLVELGPAQTLVTGCDSRSLHENDFLGALDVSQGPSAEPFGISLTSDGMPGSFAAFGLELHEHATQRFFSSVPFVDPKMAMSSTDVYVGVPVGRSSFLNQQNYVPQVTLANFGSNQVQATVQYAQSSEDNVNFRDLMSVSVPAMSSKEVIFSGLEGDPDIKNSFLVTSNAAPGDLVSKLLSKGNSQPREVELLARDAMAPENGGNHPWSLVGSNQSFLLLFNDDHRVQTFSVTIAGAHALWRKTYRLQPMQTKLVDVGAIRRNKARDDHGALLPSNLASGEVYWFNSAGSGRGRVLEANSAVGLARNFSCFVFSAPCTPASLSQHHPLSLSAEGLPPRLTIKYAPRQISLLVLVHQAPGAKTSRPHGARRTKVSPSRAEDLAILELS